MVLMGILRPDGVLHVGHQRFDFLKLHRHDAGRQAFSDPFVHGGTQVKNFQRLVNRNVTHENATVLFGAHQPGFVEHQKCFTNRPTRHTKLFSQSRFIKFGTGQILA